MKLQDILIKPFSSEEFYNSVKSRILKTESEKGFLTKEKAEYINLNVPQYKQRVIENADLAIRGLIILPGTEAKPYFVGNPPDWFANPVNHNEYVFHLNRMEHWVTLLEAYRLTNQSRYAEKFIDEFNHWLEKCPRPVIEKDINKAYESFNSVNPWRSLEAGIRLYRTWPWILKYLIDTEFMTPKLLEKYALSVYGQCEVLYEICPMFWPKADHNHYLMENLGLLTAVCLFPEFKKASIWKEHAIKELERCAIAQLTEDGGQIEGCPSYHNGCVNWFSISLVLAKESGFTFSDEYMQRVKKSIDYSLYSFRPSGTGVPWGDSSANQGAINSAIYGYILFDNSNWLHLLTNLVDKEDLKSGCLKFLWSTCDMEKLLNKVEQLYSTTCTFMLPFTSWQRQLKQVTMRTDWSKDALSIFFACRTPIGNNHAHIDPMGFDFTAYGKPLVVDPGKFTYREDEYRKNFKSAAWHNTLTIDCRDHFEYISSWRYGPQKHGDITKMEYTKDMMYAEAMHMNYEPTVHKRAIAIVDSSFILILDQVLNVKAESSIQIYYHIDSDKVVLDKENNYTYTKNDDVNVVIYSSDNVKGQLLKALVSDSNDVARDSIRLCLEDTSKTESFRKYAIVIIPYKCEEYIPIIKSIAINGSEDQLRCTFELNTKKYEFAWDNDGLKRI